MYDKMTALKAALAAFCTALGAFLGWKGIMALIWVAVMALDYISGTAAACKEGSWSSAVARSGLWHKAGMILAVICAAIADLAMVQLCDNLTAQVFHFGWPVVVTPLVLAWYILTELGSILENAVKLGAKIPGWLLKLLQAGLDAVDGTAGQGGSHGAS